MRQIAVSFVVFSFSFASILAFPGGAASAMPAATAPAQQGADPTRPRYDEIVVVTADRDAERIGDVGSTVTVVSREQIAASGARWLIDVLQFAPGVTVVRNGPPGTTSDVFLRGANSSHTLFLIDGVRANSPTTGAYDVAHLQIAADRIERIEIVRGPQSTLYGSQAIGGVINVITRRGDGPGTWGAEVDGGSYDTGRLHTWAAGQSDALRYAGSVSYFDSDGFSAADRRAGNVEADGYENLAWDGRLDYDHDSGMHARAFARGYHGDAQFDGFAFAVGPVDALRNVQETRETYAGGALGFATESFSTAAEISLSDARLDSVTPDAFFTGFFLDSSIWEIDWQNDFSLAGGQQLTAGVEYRRELATIGSESPLGRDGFDESVGVAGIYVQDRVTLGDRAHLAAGLRFVDHSTFGGKWTGRLTASVDLTKALRVLGSIGSGFKAPTLNDLYFPGFSNPLLEPEESVGLDAGLEATGRLGRAGARYFRNDITNLIQFDAGAGIPMNLGDVLAQGVELDGAVALAAALDLSGNYTYTHALPSGSDEQLIRRPRHQGGARLTWLPLAALRTWGEVRFKRGRFDAGATGRVELDPYAIVNLAADYRLSPKFLLRGRIDNLLDREFEEVVGYGVAGVSGYLGLTVTLARR